MSWKKVNDFAGSTYRWEDEPSIGATILGAIVLLLMLAALASGCS